MSGLGTGTDSNASAVGGVSIPCPPLVREKVRSFEEHLDNYKSGDYSEAQLRVDFLNPMLEALGWDVNNTAGYAEAYRDVVYEDEVKIGGASKAPDYGFYIGGRASGGGRKFFLEAKRPSVNLRVDPKPAYQLRRYAYTANLALSILTTFEDFIIYDTRLKPLDTDKATTAAILTVHYTEYPSRWHEIASIFSREAILRGSFDKYAQSIRKPRGVETVDAAFLKEIEDWRETLAKNLALRNPALSQRDLNFAVQRTIDRIIFLRMCEDRGIEPTGRLLSLLEGEDIYARLGQLFHRADEKYNSGLFHFSKDRTREEEPDELTLGLDIDEKVLKTIVKRLYDSPYEFSVMPPEILGQVYEQFLGRVITLTAGHRARVEEKPEVRKAGGVYYTPAYIVDYIVKNTVGRLLGDNLLASRDHHSSIESRPSIPPGASNPADTGSDTGITPKQAAKLRVVDPACGSGSFLIGAYQYLLDWHLRWYLAHNPDEHCKGKNPALTRGVRLRTDRSRNAPQAASLDYRLTTAKRKEILLNSLYGVDIDPQAIEVTKLSLLLKVLEGESDESINAQLKMFHQRALPDLGKNIKCGNSLIGSDFYDNRQIPLINDDERIRINVFDWKTGFPDIIGAGGFDAVIGNPPYIFTRELLSVAQREYFSTRYRASWEKHNTYMLFMEAMLRLLAPHGYGGFIVPNSWLTIESAKLLRHLYIPRISVLMDLNYAAFQRVSMEPCIFVISGTQNAEPASVARISSQDEFAEADFRSFERSRWVQAGGRLVFSTSGNNAVALLVDQLVAQSTTVGDAFEVLTGLQAYEKGKGDPRQTAAVVRDHVFDRTHKQDKHTLPYLEGRDVGRYHLNWSGSWLRYGPWLSQPRELPMFTRPRVLLREITGPFPHCLHATCVEDTYLNNKSVLNVLDRSDDIPQLHLLTGVLNSRLAALFYKERAVKSARKVFPKVVIKNLREFPFPRKLNEQLVGRIGQLVERMLDLHKGLATAKSPHDKERIPREIEAVDNQINHLVYELFGLSADQIRTVEVATQ